MAPMINPFDAGRYTLAEMTTAINILPNVYKRPHAHAFRKFDGRKCAAVESLGLRMSISLAVRFLP